MSATNGRLVSQQSEIPGDAFWLNPDQLDLAGDIRFKRGIAEF